VAAPGLRSSKGGAIREADPGRVSCGAMAERDDVRCPIAIDVTDGTLLAGHAEVAAPGLRSSKGGAIREADPGRVSCGAMAECDDVRCPIAIDVANST